MGALNLRSRIGRVLVVFTLICTIGGHWAILQSVGWVGMFASYSSSASLSVALQKTFDGKHPCEMCKLVTQGKKSEKGQERLKVDPKLDFWIAKSEAAFCLLPRLTTEHVPSDPLTLSGRDVQPPVPPPRLA